MTSITIIGAGGHGKVVLASASAAGYRIADVLDDAKDKWGSAVLGTSIAGPVSRALDDPDAICVLALGSNRVRAKLAASARCRFATVVDPTAHVHASVQLGEGTVVLAGAIVQPDTIIGAHSIVNTAASVDHDCVFGTAVHVAPGARLAGNVRLGDEVLFGIGAVAIPGTSIAAHTVVGAGAVVVHDLPANVVATGIPARARSRKEL